MKKSDNMRIILLCLFFMIKNTAGFSQNQNVLSPATSIYKITDEEAGELLTNDELEIEDKYFHTLIGIRSKGKKFKHNYRGYYLFVNSINEELNIQLNGYHSISAINLNNKRDLIIQVIDSLGNVLSDAEVFFGKKKLKYRSELKAYQKKRVRKDGFLTVKAKGETIYYEVEDQDEVPIFKKRIRRFRTSKLGWVVTTPLRWGEKGFRFFKYALRDRTLQWGIFKRRKKNKSHKGYVVTNQPKYLPGDTVKIKAYITNYKGKPLKENLKIQVRNYRHSKPLFTIPLSPITPGAYTYEFSLGDSLQLDQNYQIKFLQPRKNKRDRQIMSHSFRYEDYQLDDVDYSFKTTKAEFGGDEKVIILAEGKDQNGWTIPDGFVKITATASTINEFYEKEVIVPDTLWEVEQQLDIDDETQLIFPKENLPNVKMRISLIAKFTNTNGELQTKRTTFTYDAKKLNTQRIDVRLEGEWIIADYIVDEKSVEGEGFLDMYGDDNNVEIDERKVKFPFKERVNPFIADYDFYTEDEKAEGYIELLEYPHRARVFAKGFKTKDSILVSFQNPSRIPFTYQLRSKNKLLAEGQSDEKFFQLNLKNKNSKSVFLYHQYVWADRSFQKKTPIHFYKNLLSMKVEQPKTVEPGEQVQFKVKVKTAKDKPAKNVNLTAGAINSKFKNAQNIKHPSIGFKKTRAPLEFNNLEPIEEDGLNHKKKVINSKWYDELGLDSLLFYRMRFPEEGILMHYDSVISTDTFYQEVAQFAPYVVKDGKQEPIYMIYCNRQLVYYYDVDDDPPYSFVGRDGYNSISIRTRDYLYRIDSVMMKKGQKLELSMDLKNYRRSPLAKHITVRKRGNELTPGERDLLNRKIFILRKAIKHNKIFLWQDKTNIHSFHVGRYSKKKELKVGPFNSNNDLRLLIQDRWTNKFRFEPGFIYEVEENRERLYQSHYFDFGKKRKIVLPKKLAYKKTGQIVHSPKDIQAKSPFLDRLSNMFMLGNRRSKTLAGNYQFKYPNRSNKNSALFAIVLLQSDTIVDIFQPRLRYIRYLSPNDYQIVLFNHQGDFFKKDITIKANHLLYHDFSNNTFTSDSSNTFFNEIFLEFSEKQGKETEAQIYLSQRSSQNKGFDLPINGTSNISGIITDKNGEALIAVNVIFFQNGKVITGTVTDIDGSYNIVLPEGNYNIEISYLGFSSHKISKTISKNDNLNLDVVLKEDQMQLNEVVVIGYGTHRKRSVSGSITSEEIRDLPTRSINSIAASTAGVRATDDGDAISVRGSRSDATDYYIDGIRVSGGLIPESELQQLQLRSNFADYAFFQPNLITDQNGEAYFTATFPDNITAWNTFVVGMDDKLRGGSNSGQIQAYKKMTAQLVLPRFLIEGDKTNIVGKSQNFTLDSFNVTTAFKVGDEILKTNQAELKTALIEKAEIAAPENIDSLTLSYLLTTENYGDGEERQIPVFQKGVEEFSGVFKVLDEGRSFSTNLDINKGPIKIRIENNVLDLLLNDLTYLRRYPYGCNEQTASRLVALLLEKDLKKLQGKKFDGEKEILRAIRRLKKTQNQNGSWGWWQNGKDNIWMTTYVLNALQKAKDHESKYKVNFVEKGLVYLTNYLEELEGKQLLDALLLFSDINQNLDFEKHLIQLDTSQHSMYDKFAIAKIKQAQEIPFEIDSLLQYEQQQMFGGIYFGEDNWHWYNNSSQISLLAYDIFKMRKDSTRAKQIQNYFLSKKSKRGWRNTIVTAKVLNAILPDLMNDGAIFSQNKVRLTGGLNETITNFPFEATLVGDGEINVVKDGVGPVYFTAYQEFCNKKPEQKDDLFEIKTYLKQEDKKTDNLQATVAADLIVEVEVKQGAEYVMIEIPIPAGCSYRSKPINYRGKESYREYFKNRTAIFCEDLPVGKYEFKIPLEPRFSGKYTLNPTKVEQMYFPVFFGRNEMKKVDIE